MGLAQRSLCSSSALESGGRNSGVPRKRRDSPAGSQMDQPRPLGALRRRALAHLHTDGRGAATGGSAGAAPGRGARARPDSSAQLAHSLVPGFRAQHGGQGDSNSLLLLLLHKRRSKGPECSPPPLSIAFFAWFLTSASRGSRLRVESCAGLGPERRGCPAGGGEGGGIVSWRGS